MKLTILYILIVLAVVHAHNNSKKVTVETIELTYTKDILPIIQNRCAICHNGSTPERNWLDYKTAYNKRNSIKLRLENRTMPIGLTMLDSERKLMIDWINQGAKK